MNNDKIYKLIQSENKRDMHLGYTLLMIAYPQLENFAVSNDNYSGQRVIDYLNVKKILPDFPGYSFVHPDEWSEEYFKT